MDKGRCIKRVFKCLFFALATSVIYLTDSHAATSTNIDVTCNIAANLSMQASNDINLPNLAPQTFYKQNTDVNVVTNSPYGYTLSISMSRNDASKNNSLNLDATNKIPSLSQTTSEANFPKETGGWGFSLGSDSYSPLPTVSGDTYSSKLLKRTNSKTSTDGDDTTVTMGIMPGKSVSGGTYSNIVTFSAVVNPATITVTSIEITNPPNKTNYTAGDDFDDTGMVVVAHYSDGSSAQVFDYVIENGANLSAGTYAMIIAYTYNGVTVRNNTSVTVTVSNGSGTNGGNTNQLMQSAPRRASGAQPSTSMETDNTNQSSNAEQGNVEPQGRISGYSNLTDGLIGDILLAICVSAALGMIFFIILALRRDDDDDEEKESTKTGTSATK